MRGGAAVVPRASLYPAVGTRLAYFLTGRMGPRLFFSGKFHHALPERRRRPDDAQPADAEQVPAGESLVGLDRVERDGLLELLPGLEVDDDDFFIVRLRVGVRRGGDFRDADDRALVAGVVDQGEVALAHGAQVLQGGRVGDAVPGGLAVAREVVVRVLARLGLQKPECHVSSRLRGSPWPGGSLREN